MKKLLLSLVSLPACAGIYTNTPPSLVDGHLYPLHLPDGEVSAIVAETFSISSVECNQLFSYQTSVAAMFGSLTITNNGYLGFILHSSDITGFPTESLFTVMVNNEPITVKPGYLGFSGAGIITIIPTAPDAFAEIEKISWAYPPPTMVAQRDGLHFTANRGQKAVVSTSTNLTAWSKCAELNFSSSTLTTNLPGTFFRVE